MRSVLTLASLSIVSALAACAPEGSSAYVTSNIPPDASCIYSATANLFTPIGQYDVGDGAHAPNCRNSYFMNLLVNSNLKSNAREAIGRAEPNVLQIMEADVRLMDKNQATLVFKDPKTNMPDPAFPNPFRVQTANSLFPATTTMPSTGVASIEAIPKAYGPKLTSFADDKILIEVQLFGTTTGDVAIDFKPFVYPVGICRGCLSICNSDATSGGKTKTDLYGDKCADNAAQDGRICVDPSC
jgi:hypothetical protein